MPTKAVLLPLTFYMLPMEQLVATDYVIAVETGSYSEPH
jgi:hypothetical protein